MSVKVPQKYVVQYDLDEDGWWVATVKGVPGCHTQGRTIVQASTRIVEALSACLDADASRFEYTRDVRLPEKVRALVDKSAAHARASEEAAKVAEKARTAAAAALRRRGISLRDAGLLLGLSHARVHQISRQ